MNQIADRQYSFERSDTGSYMEAQTVEVLSVFVTSYTGVMYIVQRV